jgi:hypothetical protein
MRRVLFALFRLALLAGVMVIAREVMLERAPQTALNGTQPVIGSLDTWPEVPRKPTG